jgi:hypothetical protein
VPTNRHAVMCLCICMLVHISHERLSVSAYVRALMLYKLFTLKHSLHAVQDNAVLGVVTVFKRLHAAGKTGW